MAAITSPTCPRCGYDQSGAVAAWNHAESSSCPLTATCSECGLGFEWADVFNTERIRLRGFYEHAGGVALLIAWRTWLWTWNPALFWSRVRLEHRVRVPRLLLWLVVLIVPLQMFHAVAVCGERVRYAQHLNSVFAATPARSSIPAGQPTRIPVNWDGIVPVFFGPLFGEESRVPVWNMQFTWTPSGTKVTFPTPTGKIFTPVSLAHRDWPDFVKPLLAFALFMLGMLLVLSESRAQAKVHRRHVLRASVYGAAWLPLLALIRFCDQAGWWAAEFVAQGAAGSAVPWGSWNYLSSGWRIDEWLHKRWPLALVLLAIWVSLWWLVAVARGFRLSRPAAVWLSMLVPSLLAAFTVLVVTSSQFARFLEGVLSHGVWRWE